MDNSEQKPLAKLTTKEHLNTNYSYQYNVRENVPVYHIDIGKIVSKYYKKLYDYKFDNIGEIKPLKVTNNEIYNMIFQKILI